MLTFTITIESPSEGVSRISPSFDGRKCNDFESDIFEEILERMAPGLILQDGLDSRMDYLIDELHGLHDPNTVFCDHENKNEEEQ